MTRRFEDAEERGWRVIKRRRRRVPKEVRRSCRCKFASAGTLQLTAAPAQVGRARAAKLEVAQSEFLMRTRQTIRVRSICSLLLIDGADMMRYEASPVGRREGPREPLVNCYDGPPYRARI